jgi:hypothetical protein
LILEITSYIREICNRLVKNKPILGLGIAITLTMAIVTAISMLQSTQAAINRVGGDVTAGGGAHLVELEKSTMHRAPIATSGNSVYVAWPSNKTGNYEIMFRASSDNGKTFGALLKLAANGTLGSSGGG